MNISFRWLKAIAPAIEGTPAELAERLGMLGAPVDELHEVAADLGDVVIARVESVRQHPNADRLRLCSVNAGGAQLQVVCGAPNVEAGSYYPFAPIGATLPGGLQIKKAKLRGEDSEGMLCSARELGLGKEHAGLMTLNGEWEPGVPFVDTLEMEDARLVLDITPNRSDLLSHIGVARELAPNGVADVSLPPFPGEVPARSSAPEAEKQAAGSLKVDIANPEECPRYMAAVIAGVTVAPSPEWLATRLRAVGLRPINNVVDATNYVLHELGQPLHAFDLQRLAGPEIRVRRARPGEQLRTLDGTDRELTDSELVIADRDRAVALAGIMGGEESEVGSGTTSILLECALFDPKRIRSTARSLGLSTDASHRYERGVDPAEQPRALERVIELILLTAGGHLQGPIVDNNPTPFAPLSLELRPSRVKKVLGVDLELSEIGSILTPIGFRGEGDDEGLRVEVPAYRPDVTREIDVIEEIARRRGYDSFDADPGYYRPGTVPADPLLLLQQRIHNLLHAWGFIEARTVAFAPAGESRAGILNPLSAEESHLRDDLVTGLVRRAEGNWAHGVRSVRLYEIGTIFKSGAADMPREEIHVAAIFSGSRAPGHWSSPPEPFDFWDLKGLGSELAGILGAELAVAGASGVRDDLIDPSEALLLRSGSGEILGRAGRVAARKVDAPAWADPLWALEATLIMQAGPPVSRRFSDLPAYPGVERDMALILGSGVEAAAVEAVIRRMGGALLSDLRPFDLYSGKGIPEGTRSVAWRLRFRHAERTLVDSEVDQVIAGILSALHEELNVERR